MIVISSNIIDKLHKTHWVEGGRPLRTYNVWFPSYPVEKSQNYYDLLCDHNHTDELDVEIVVMNEGICDDEEGKHRWLDTARAGFHFGCHPCILTLWNLTSSLIY